MTDADLLDEAAVLAAHADCLDRAARDPEAQADPRVAACLHAMAALARSASRITGQGSGISQTTTDPPGDAVSDNSPTDELGDSRTWPRQDGGHA